VGYMKVRKRCRSFCEEKQNIIQHGSQVTEIIMMFSIESLFFFFNSFNDAD
jgi:hypothetical protein